MFAVKECDAWRGANAASSRVEPTSQHFQSARAKGAKAHHFSASYRLAGVNGAISQRNFRTANDFRVGLFVSLRSSAVSIRRDFTAYLCILCSIGCENTASGRKHKKNAHAPKAWRLLLTPATAFLHTGTYIIV